MNAVNKKALIIEDDAFLVANLSELLQFEGFEVQAVTDGCEAPQMARLFQPDIILSDIRLPGMDGFAILDAVRRDPQTAQTPFVFISGRSESAQMHAALSQGADAYLIKPFPVEDLLAVVSQLVPA
jgi:CheY-like chemotaxis protein